MDTIISERLSLENKSKLSQLTRADFVTISEINTRVSELLSLENKAKLSQLIRAGFFAITKLTH